MRLGVTIPLPDVGLRDHQAPLARLVEAGFEEVSTGEVNGFDALTPLTLISAWQPKLVLSAAVLPVFTRGPALLAMSAAALAEAAPGRVRFGIGSGSDRTVQAWNGVPFQNPHRRVADVLRFLRAVLRDGRAGSTGLPLGVREFHLTRRPAVPPDLVLAALGPRMQRLARAEADGVVLTLLSPDDVRFIREQVAGVPRDLPRQLELSARLFVVPGEDPSAEAAARRHLAAYLTVPVYSRYQAWLGRGARLGPVVEAWNDGRRQRASELIPDDVLEDLIVAGSPAACAARIRGYAAAGIDLVTVSTPDRPPGESDPDGWITFLCEVARRLVGDGASAG